jgi:hypothetical protein
MVCALRFVQLAGMRAAGGRGIYLGGITMRRQSTSSIKPAQARSAQARTAHGSSARAATAVINHSATVALWRVLNALRDGWFLEKRLRNVALMIVDEAHRQHLDAEQMLAALRAEWPRLLERRRIPVEEDLQMVADRLTAFCRSEFYSVAGRGLR